MERLRAVVRLSFCLSTVVSDTEEIPLIKSIKRAMNAISGNESFRIFFNIEGFSNLFITYPMLVIIPIRGRITERRIKPTITERIITSVGSRVAIISESFFSVSFS